MVMPPKSSNKTLLKYEHNSSTSVGNELKYAVDNSDAKIEKKLIGQRKGLRTVVTIGDKKLYLQPQ